MYLMDDKMPLELRTERFTLKEVFPARAKKYAQKLHRKADEIEFVRKGIPIDPADISIDDGERAAIRLVTTPRLDRDYEILLPDGAILDDFRQSPSVFWGHDYQRLPVGHDAWVKIEKRGILAKTLYANHQFAEDVFQCVKHGDLSSNSVGFVPVEWVGPSDKGFRAVADLLEKDYGVPREEIAKARRVYTKWIMLEHSDVGVASNAHALNLAVSKGELNLCDSFKHDMGMDAIEAEKKEEPTVEAKILDDAGKPSTYDIMEAINSVLSIPEPPEGRPHEWRYVCELYPTDYPSGHCIFIHGGESIGYSQYRQDYTYADGEAKLIGLPVEVVASYTDKAAPISAPVETAPVTEKGTGAPIADTVTPAPDLAAMLQAISTRLDGIEARLAPKPEPVEGGAGSIVLPPPADFIALDPEPDILASIDAPAPKSLAVIASKSDDITAENVVAIIDKLDLRAVIQDAVVLALDKARGRVR
jgi:hypothetical protein